MKIAKLLLPIVIFFYSCSSKKVEKSELTEMNINAQVKFIKEFSFQMTERFGYYSKNNITYCSDTYFDIHGNKTKKVIYKTSGDVKSTVLYKYDNKGNKIEIIYYNLDGKVIGRTTYKYNDVNQRTEMNIFNSGGMIKNKTKYYYDKMGYILEKERYNPQESLLDRRIYVRNKKGLCVVEKIIKSNNVVSKYQYDYDSNNNKIQSQYFLNDTLFVFNNKFVYEYDDKKNWIQRIQYKNGIPKYIRMREIEYY